jgi:hypothetical protein
MSQTIFEKDGYLMRSHSETRWAAMMDALRVTWLYEDRHVETRHGGYIPDFYLPAAGMFIEVKGPTPTAVEREKAMDAQRQTGCPVIFAYGRPEMLHGELFHGLLSYFGERGEITHSTTEVGSAVRKYFDLHTYAAYITAGEHLERPDVLPVAEILQELVAGWMPRPERENYMRSIHAPLNRAKTEKVGQISQVEWVLSEFAKKINDCWNAKEAA